MAKSHFSRLFRHRLAMSEYRLHIIMGTLWKCQHAILSFHVIARALRPKQSSRITAFNTIIALFIFSRLLRHWPAMSETSGTSQKAHITVISPSKPMISRHCEGTSPEAIQ